ncbi:MAG: pilus assembly protein PilP [Pseudomonadales bacterium]|nr:pilus assembly protein PilP [Pseudomonadales bacterium]
MKKEQLQRRTRARTVLLLASSLLLAACSRTNNLSDLQGFVDEVKSRPGAVVEPVPEFVPYEAFIYGAASLRSPFEVPMQIDPNSNVVLNQDIEPDFDRAREPLESQALSELAMVGVLERGGVYQALIEDAFGEVHRVGIGNFLGRNYGRINFISSNQINIRTIVPSGSGGWVERPQSLTLQ